MGIASGETRKRALAAYKAGKGTQAEIAAFFGISTRTFQRWCERFKRSGSTHPKKRGHREAAYSGVDLKRLDRTIRKHPDATLEELRRLTHKSCSIMAVQRAVLRLGYSLKKTLSASERNRADVRRRRNQWLTNPLRRDPHRLIFIDESGAKTNMARLWGRARRGARVIDHVPHGHWNTTTMIGSIRLDGTVSCMAVEGATTAEVFREYVRQVLCPTLREGDIVIADNLSAHKDAQSKALICACGATFEFLPPYSPDFNPIENMWSTVKSHLRAARARTNEALVSAIGHALSTVTPSDAAGFFSSCGYTTSQS
jgi:transposase